MREPRKRKFNCSWRRLTLCGSEMQGWETPSCPERARLAFPPLHHRRRFTSMPFLTRSGRLSITKILINVEGHFCRRVSHNSMAEQILLPHDELFKGGFSTPSRRVNENRSCTRVCLHLTWDPRLMNAALVSPLKCDQPTDLQTSIYLASNQDAGMYGILNSNAVGTTKMQRSLVPRTLTSVDSRNRLRSMLCG